MHIGLCLSGGGARGIFHMGVLKAIDQLGIKVSIISGCSAGALVATLYAAGVKPDKMLSLAIQTKWFSFIKPSLPKRGLMGLDYLEYILKTQIKQNEFNELDIPIKIVATNISKGTLAIFEEGPFIKSVLASCSVPMIFKPVKIEDQYYLDGGILMNLPASIIRKDCDFLIGVSLMPVKSLPIEDINTGLKILTRVLELSVYNNSKQQMGICDILIESQLINDFSRFDLNRANELFHLGYESGISSLEGKSFGDSTN